MIFAPLAKIIFTLAKIIFAPLAKIIFVPPKKIPQYHKKKRWIQQFKSEIFQEKSERNGGLVFRWDSAGEG